jgi:lysophospholipase L1-like esterase
MVGLLSVIGLLAQASARGLPQESPYAKEIAAFKASDRVSPQPKGQIVFIGSSSFTRWATLKDAFPEHRVLNRAFGGSTLTDVIRHVEDVVFPYEPCQVVIYCGENDFAADEKVVYDTVVDRFKVLFSKIRKHLPGTAIAYVSMKPSPSRWSYASKFIAANAAIKEFRSTKPRTAFIDVWPAMLGNDGQPRSEIYVEDRLHMNDDGYKLWAPLISKILVDRGRKQTSHKLRAQIKQVSPL